MSVFDDRWDADEGGAGAAGVAGPTQPAGSADDPSAPHHGEGGAGRGGLDDTPEPEFATVIDWVEGFLVPIVRRRITRMAGEGLSWDERWWLYPEVVARLTALHYAWEGARVDASMSAMSAWWIQHLEPHLRVILDSQDGPMANASDAREFAGWPRMPIQPVPGDLVATITGGR